MRISVETVVEICDRPVFNFHHLFEAPHIFYRLHGQLKRRQLSFEFDKVDLGVVPLRFGQKILLLSCVWVLVEQVKLEIRLNGD